MADTRDLKSLAARRAGSSPAGGTHPNKETKVPEYQPPKVIPIRPDRDDVEAAILRHPSSKYHDPDPAPEFADGIFMILTILFLVGFWTGVAWLVIKHLF